MKVLGLITARGGSKGVPGKNIAPIAGKPLIGWTIEAAQRSRRLSRCIVSTDSDEIAAVANSLGGEVPFLRPSELAQDETPHGPVILHALDWMRDREEFLADYVMVLQPTSPMRSASDIDAAIEIAARTNADSVIGMVEPHGHPLWCKSVATDGRIVLPVPNTGVGEALRRQDLPIALLPNGAIYLLNVEFFRRSGRYYGERSYALTMPPERSLDVDTPWDLEIARLVMAKRTSDG